MEIWIFIRIHIIFADIDFFFVENTPFIYYKETGSGSSHVQVSFGTDV